jgi:hypothetical protein
MFLVSVSLVENQESFSGTTYVSCPSGTSVLSCGIGDTQMSNHEVYRKAYPASSSTCTCYDYFGASCRAWCSNKVANFAIQNSGTKSGHFSVSCPAGSKVLGCHIQPDMSVTPELWRAYYPSNDGSSCNCYDYFGSNCVASCATNVVNYQVGH